ncbi:hypothetical protein Tco_1069530 [Tanacetum coccineum]|uniref:Uncharacterized protein n=1 Tax=Tanacetum coccineum TaxID=301880 RepID=A0ABQ5HIT4_9ASTR
MWNLRRIMELQASAQSTTWSDVLSLYFWRTKEADQLEASPGWVVNKDRSIEYLQELVQRDEEMVQRLQALEREVEERAGEKMLFVEKLKGNVAEGDDSSPTIVNLRVTLGSTPPSYSSGPSIANQAILQTFNHPTNNYSLGSSRRESARTAKLLRGKISVPKANNGHAYASGEKHTVNSADYHGIQDVVNKVIKRTYVVWRMVCSGLVCRFRVVTKVRYIFSRLVSPSSIIKLPENCKEGLMIWFQWVKKKKEEGSEEELEDEEDVTPGTLTSGR